MTKRTETIIPKASKEMILEATKLTNAEARFLVSDYYASQEMRKRLDMQVRHQGDASMKERIGALEYMGSGFALMETEVHKMLKKYAEASPVGRWMLSQHGVGPVIVAGMLANISIDWLACPKCGKKANAAKTCDCAVPYETVVCETAGQIWRFSGLDPTCKWEKGQKRPYNPDMKQLCYHFGECVKRTSGSPLSFYGQFYKERKQLLEQRNEAGAFAERAKTFECKSAEWKKILKTGKLPAGNLDRQACNQTAKMFLSHLHAVMYWNNYGKAPPKPFAIAILGHAHEVRIPNADMFPGFEKAYYGSKKGNDYASTQQHIGRRGGRSGEGIQEQKPRAVPHRVRLERVARATPKAKATRNQSRGSRT